MKVSVHLSAGQPMSVCLSAEKMMSVCLSAGVGPCNGAKQWPDSCHPVRTQER